MKKILSAFALTCIILASCSKSDDNVVVPDKYMSITTGSKWVYDVTTNPGTAGATTVTDTVTVTSTDTTVEAGTANQRTYRIFKHSNGNVSDYYNITVNDYYRFQVLPLNGIQIQNLYLKDNATVGTAWSQNISVNVPGFGPIPITITNSITEIGLSKTVNGVAYTKVINVKTDINSLVLPAGTITTDIKSYYAPKVGLIEGDYKVSIPLVTVDVNNQTLLKSATIL